MGRRPKPTALHRAQGTFNATKHGRDRAKEPIAIGDLVEPPPDLTDDQQAAWTYAIANAPPGLLKRIDSAILKLWVEAETRHNTARMMQAMLDRDATLKLLIKTPMGLEVSPYNLILERTAKTMIRLAAELGFSPAARPRLHVDTPDDRKPDADADPWSVLRVIPGGKASRTG